MNSHSPLGKCNLGLNLQAQNSSFYKQYNDSLPNGTNNPALLPGTNMQFAFDPQ